MKFVLIVAGLACAPTLLWAQVQIVTPVPGPASPVPVDPPMVIVDPPYDSPNIKVIGDGSRTPFLPPVTRIPEDPSPPPAWGPRSFFTSGRFLNFSVRGLVGQGEQVLIGGMVVSEGNRVLLVRAVGPTLSSYGISGVLARPQLEIFNSAGIRVARAVPWSANDLGIRNELKQAAVDVGAFALPESSQDQVLLLVLERGSYTCVVSSDSGATGIVLLEAYEVPGSGPSG